MKDFIDKKRKEIEKLNPKNHDKIFADGLKTSLDLAINSYEEELRRSEKIQNSITGLLTFVSFLFGGFVIFIVNFKFQYFKWDSFLVIPEAILITVIMILLIIATRYHSYECFVNPEKQVIGTFDKLIHDYGVIDNKFIPGLKETILLCDYVRVFDSVQLVNDKKKKMLNFSAILLSIFIFLFLISLILTIVGGYANAIKQN